MTPRVIVDLPSLTLGAEWGLWIPFSKLPLSGRKPRAVYKQLLDRLGMLTALPGSAWLHLALHFFFFFFMNLRKMELGLPCRKGLAD